MPAVKPARVTQPGATAPRAEDPARAAGTATQESWFDEAIVLDSEWAVIYTTREDGSRRGIRVPLRAFLAPEDTETESSAAKEDVAAEG